MAIHTPVFRHCEPPRAAWQSTPSSPVFALNYTNRRNGLCKKQSISYLLHQNRTQVCLPDIIFGFSFFCLVVCCVIDNIFLTCTLARRAFPGRGGAGAERGGAKRLTMFITTFSTPRLLSAYALQSLLLICFHFLGSSNSYIENQNTIVSRLYHNIVSYKSNHSGFAVSIKSSFFFLDPLLICFSRSIADVILE